MRMTSIARITRITNRWTAARLQCQHYRHCRHAGPVSTAWTVSLICIVRTVSVARIACISRVASSTGRLLGVGSIRHLPREHGGGRQDGVHHRAQHGARRLGARTMILGEPGRKISRHVATLWASTDSPSISRPT